MYCFPQAQASMSDKHAEQTCVVFSHGGHFLHALLSAQRTHPTWPELRAGVLARSVSRKATPPHPHTCWGPWEGPANHAGLPPHHFQPWKGVDFLKYFEYFRFAKALGCQVENSCHSEARATNPTKKLVEPSAAAHEGGPGTAGARRGPACSAG